MIHEGIVYFSGPESQWSGKVSEREIIARRSFRWKWAARAFAKAAHRNLDPARCGYAVFKGGIEIEHVEPLVEVLRQDDPMFEPKPGNALGRMFKG